MVFCRLTFAFTAVVEGQHQVVNLNVAQIAVLHIPHSCKFVPVEGRQAVRLDNAALDNEHAAHDRQLHGRTVSGDPGRSRPLDEQEPMVARGMGIVLGRWPPGTAGVMFCMIGTVGASPRHRNAPKRHVFCIGRDSPAKTLGSPLVSPGRARLSAAGRSGPAHCSLSRGGRGAPPVTKPVWGSASV
jgi:hypothetical protein